MLSEVLILFTGLITVSTIDVATSSMLSAFDANNSSVRMLSISSEKILLSARTGSPFWSTHAVSYSSCARRAVWASPAGNSNKARRYDSEVTRARISERLNTSSTPIIPRTPNESKWSSLPKRTNSPILLTKESLALMRICALVRACTTKACMPFTLPYLFPSVSNLPASPSVTDWFIK